MDGNEEGMHRVSEFMTRASIERSHRESRISSQERSQPYGKTVVPLTTSRDGARYDTIGWVNTHRTGARPATPLPRKERWAVT